MKTRFEIYLKNIIKGRKKGFLAWLIKLILLPVSWLYGLGVSFRNRLYERGWMRRYVPPVPLVISVGNIVAGGSGKTPVTLLIAKKFSERFAVAILSRGYRSKAENLESPVVLCEGAGPTLPASYCGDEPYLLAQRLPKSMVIVGGDRRKASFMAAKSGAQAIFLDDGMQHRRLARDFDVVVMDVGDPFGQGYFLPRGFLRDDLSSLSRAHLIVLNHIDNEEEFLSVQNELKSYSHAPMIGVSGFVSSIRDFKGQEAPSLKGKKAGMVCAIANPEYFKRTLEKEGLIVEQELIKADHISFHKNELHSFAQDCLKKGIQCLVCTEKDRVKLESDLHLPLPFYWVELELSVVAGQEEWSSFLQRAESKIT